MTFSEPVMDIENIFTKGPEPSSTSKSGFYLLLLFTFGYFILYETLRNSEGLCCLYMTIMVWIDFFFVDYGYTPNILNI